MMTVIWYGVGAGGSGGGSFFVTLSPAGGEEQALVDTLFPQIYGKRRGVSVHTYAPGGGSKYSWYDGDKDAEFAALAAINGGQGGAGVAEDGKETEEGGGGALDPSTLFARMHVWEAADEVPDPDDVRARDEGMLEEEEEKEEEEGGPVVDASGGEGYTQVYAIMAPGGTAGPRATVGGVSLYPRTALFRFGSWIYAGGVDFSVPTLRLGDVPFVLPAVQKQQGRLGFLCEANAMPGEHPLTPMLQSFMGAVSVLKAEMEDAQEEVAELAAQSVNGWIDEEWAASFFELSFVPTSVPGIPPSPAGGPGAGLAGAEVIAAKVYLFGGTGVVLHCVWYASSLYCVLADSVEDLPLLDVAFPDVTARNRVVQVRSYEERTARKLAAAFPGCPMPKALRVWEGRRKGVAGVGAGAGGAVAASGAEGDAIRTKAAERAEREAGKGVEEGKSDALPAGAGGDVKEGEEEEGIYDMGGLKNSLHAAAAAAEPAKAAAPASTTTMPSQLMHSSASLSRGGPGGHTAPLNRSTAAARIAGGGAAAAMPAEEEAVGGTRLLVVGGGVGASNSKDEEAPWDASGRPKR